MTPSDYLSLSVAVVSLIATLLAVGRLVFVTEERVERLREDVKALKDMAAEFNGPARSKHVELMGRVDALERQALKFATTEAVNAVGDRVDAGFKHLEALIRAERHRRTEKDNDDV